VHVQHGTRSAKEDQPDAKRARKGVIEGKEPSTEEGTEVPKTGLATTSKQTKTVESLPQIIPILCPFAHKPSQGSGHTHASTCMLAKATCFKGHGLAIRTEQATTKETADVLLTFSGVRKKKKKLRNPAVGRRKRNASSSSSSSSSASSSNSSSSGDPDFVQEEDGESSGASGLLGEEEEEAGEGSEENNEARYNLHIVKASLFFLHLPLKFG